MSTPLVTIREIAGESVEMEALQAIIEGAPEYLNRIAGLPPGRAEAQSMFSSLPEGKSYADKFVFGIYVADQMVGCADVIRSFPSTDVATLGLLLIAAIHQHKGYGARAYSLVEQRIRSWPGIGRVRIGVVRSNEEVLPFWRRMGFVETGQVQPYQHEKVVSETLILEKSLGQ